MDLDFVLGVEFVCLMGDGGSGKKITSTKEMENLSLGISSKRFSRDLLQRFMGSGSSNEVEGLKEEDEDEGIELNLGLSLGGRFGVDKSSKGLVRSSSIASCLPVVRDDNDMVATIPSSVEYTGLVRTSSLPVETEEEWRKRKELQSLRRLEAKRRRSEKQRVVKGGDKESGGSGISRGGSLSLEERKDIEVNLRERLEREKCLAAVKKLSSSVGLSPWAAAAASQVILRSGSDVAIALAKGKGSSSGGIRDFGLPVPQASVESKGGSSSSVSDLESKTQQGSTGELSPGSIQSMQNGTNQDGGSRAIGESTSSRAEASSSKKSDTSRTRGRESATGTNSLQDMPSVFTKGDGPNGRRVDGILYKYGKGEEVRIMCVCHGSFHSPAEFVQHAGGTDVDNPLKHIVINPSSSSLL